MTTCAVGYLGDGYFWLALPGQEEPYVPAPCFGFLALMTKGRGNLLSAARLDTL